MLEELKLLAPMYLYLSGDSKKHYLSFNNYHCWPVHVRTGLRRCYSEMLKRQLASVSGRFYGEVSCTVVIHPPKDDRVRDTDDHCFLHAKWANDALKEAGLYNDDRCVIDVHMLSGETSRTPHISLHYHLKSPAGQRCEKPHSESSPASVHAVMPVMDPAVAARSYTPPRGKRKAAPEEERPCQAGLRDPKGRKKHPVKRSCSGR